jgi:glycosyltransferase involved in cell wall biosynthesis
MKKGMLSVVIPCIDDPYIQPTVDSLLAQAGGEVEVILVLDGYEPETPFKEDPRVRILRLSKNGGMRNAINEGVKIARGEFIMRTDSHCVFGDNYDLHITTTCQPNWIMTLRRYFLDPVKWEVMDLPFVDHEKLVVQGGKKFSGRPWRERDEMKEGDPISETMAMQGSMWAMPKKWWDDVIGELQTEGYGPLIQDSHEMVFKTWKAGGKLMLNKNSWFAHKHRSFPRQHNNGTKETPANCDDGYAYALEVWGDYYENEIRPAWGI